MLVRTQTPITSAVIAVPKTKSTAILLIVIHLSPINACDNDSTAASSVDLGAAVPRIFHLSVLLPVHHSFLCPAAPKFAQ